MVEQWLRWEPIEDSTSLYYVTSIFYDTPGLTVLLKQQKNENKKVSMLFDTHIAAYVFTDISHPLNRSKNKEKYGDLFLKDAKFFMVLNSHYLQRLSVQSCGISDARNLKHFVIVALDGIIEVISPFKPIVTEVE